MANKRHNKQVPGYKKGGKVKMMGGGMMMKRPMMKKGGMAKLNPGLRKFMMNKMKKKGKM